MTSSNLPRPQYSPSNVWPAPAGPAVTDADYEEDLHEAVTIVNRKASAFVTALLVTLLTVFLVNQNIEGATFDVYLINVLVNLGIVLAINTVIRMVASRRGRGNS